MQVALEHREGSPVNKKEYNKHFIINKIIIYER